MSDPGPPGITQPHYQATRKNQRHIPGINLEPLATLRIESRMSARLVNG